MDNASLGTTGIQPAQFSSYHPMRQQVLSIGDILPKVFEDIERSKQHEQVQLESIFKDIISANHVQGGVIMSGFKKGTVFLTVENSAKLYYWKARQSMVLKRFQERRPDVINIVFKIGKTI